MARGEVERPVNARLSPFRRPAGEDSGEGFPSAFSVADRSNTGSMFRADVMKMDKSKSNRQSKSTSRKQARRRWIPLPRAEYEFDKLDTAELGACLRYEHEREYVRKHRAAILQEAAEIDQLDESEREKFRQKLELQNQLDALQRLAPWLTLEAAHRQRLVGQFAEQRSPKAEAIRLYSDLMRVEQFMFRSPHSSHERIEIVVNWARMNEVLFDSFRRLIEKQRSTPGTKAQRTHLIETRGRYTNAGEGLVELVAWRCRKANLTLKETIRILRSLDKTLPVPSNSTLEKKMAEKVRSAEKAMFGLPTRFSS